jgi:hypothetical protein
MKQTFLDYKKFFLISFVIGMIAIAISNVIIIQRDRNRNEVYGELFWEYGLEVYNFNDDYLRQEFDVPEDSLLGDYLNVTFEYPPLTLYFFAIMTGVYPGVYGFQHIFINMVMFFFFNLNVLLIIHMGEKLRDDKWFWIFVAGYYVVGLLLSTGGAKMETLTNTLTLLSIMLYKKDKFKGANLILGFAVMVKFYPIMLLPFYIYKTRKKAAWFFVSMLLVAVLLPNAQGMFSTLTMHISNDFRYISYVTNSIFFGFIYSNPLSAITLALFAAYIIPTIEQLKNKENIYFVLLPAALFLFRHIMPWYFFWPAPLVMIIDNKRDMKKFIKTICVITLLYGLGMLINFEYFLESKLLEDMTSHFKV